MEVKLTEYQEALALWRGFLRTGNEAYLKYIPWEYLDPWITSFTGVPSNVQSGTVSDPRE